MSFTRLLEIATVIFIIMLVVSQVIVPFVMGRKTFPLFRRQGKLEAELTEAQQERAERGLMKRIRKLRKRS